MSPDLHLHSQSHNFQTPERTCFHKILFFPRISLSLYQLLPSVPILYSNVSLHLIQNFFDASSSSGHSTLYSPLVLHLGTEQESAKRRVVEELKLKPEKYYVLLNQGRREFQEVKLINIARFKK